MKQHNAEKVLSGREKTETSNDHDILYRFEEFDEFYAENLLLYNFRQKRISY